MNWEAVRNGLLDELHKIAAVSLAGLSPETVLSQKSPPPMETEGYHKATKVLDLAAQMKTAGVYRPAKQTEDPYVKHIRPAGRAALKGMGTSFALGSLHNVAAHGTGAMAPKKNLALAGVGAAAGLADHFYTTHALKNNPKLKQASTPAQQLHSSQQVGKIRPDLAKGPSIQHQIRGSLVGHKGTLPT